MRCVSFAAVLGALMVPAAPATNAAALATAPHAAQSIPAARVTPAAQAGSPDPTPQAVAQATAPHSAQSAPVARVTPAVHAAPAVCAKRPAAAASLTLLRDAMSHGRFIAYQPTSQQVTNGQLTQADPGSIRADLTVLRPRFDSLITYNSINGAEAIPGIAASLGFRAVVIGIWDPFDARALNAALTTAKNNPTVVVGLSLGNEMLFFHRHTAAELVALLDTVHAQAPQLALATTEPFQMFETPDAAPLLQRMDFLLANVHPIFQPWFATASDRDATQFVVNVVSDLAASYCGPVLVKETGIPTAPAEKGFTEQRQASFYVELQRRFAMAAGGSATPTSQLTQPAASAAAATPTATTPSAAPPASTAPASSPPPAAPTVSPSFAAPAAPPAPASPSPPARAFAYFSAFDAPWRINDAGPAPGQRSAPEEAHWGLYDEKRRPKPVVASIPLLTSRSSPPHHD